MTSTNKWAFALGALGAATLIRRAFPPFQFKGKVVLVTGGSRGLGLILARQLARQGARLAICARDATELAGAQDELVSLGAEVLAVACDVGDEAQAQIFIDQSLRRYGHIDVLINNAGIIQVAPQESMGLPDFRDVLAANFWGTVHASLAALPHMRKRRQGRIVNITSIGGAVAVPHLLPYSCSKFAATGFSEGLTAEVAKDGIQVTTILPSLMRTGSFVNALFKGRQDDELAWFAFGSTMPGLSMAAERAAARILRACQRGSPYVTLGLNGKLLRLIHALLPGTTVRVLSAVNRLLPAAGGAGPGDPAEPGWQHRPARPAGFLQRLGNRAARRNREVRWAAPETA
jgi:NAD(P)-dependent dehydrogenase (short-subunit alcohol dehydrogenase family)